MMGVHLYNFGVKNCLLLKGKTHGREHLISTFWRNQINLIKDNGHLWIKKLLPQPWNPKIDKWRLPFVHFHENAQFSDV